jgi:hypothetical protein
MLVMPQESISEAKNLPDEYVRVPKPKARFYGLSRSTWLEIAAQVPGMMVTIKKRRNAQRGINLLHLPTVLRYLESLKSGSSGSLEAKSEEPTKEAKKLKGKRPPVESCQAALRVKSSTLC